MRASNRRGSTAAAGRRGLLGLTALATLPGIGSAQSNPAYPTRPIRLIVPWNPGAFTDAGARLVAGKLRDEWGQPVVVENRAGANGMLGSAAAARAAPDGYTLLLATADTHSINPTLYRNVPYDAARDFVPVAPIATLPLVLALHPSQRPQTLAELIAAAKAGPGQLRFGSWGEGSTAHLAAALLQSVADIEVLHVSYRGAAAFLTDLIAGHVDGGFISLPMAMSTRQQNSVRMLGITSPARHAALPDLPAIAETFPGFEVQLWYGVMAPAGTPAPIVVQLTAAIQRGLQAEDVRDRLSAAQVTAMLASPEEFARFTQEQLRSWGRIVELSGVRLD